MSDPRETLSVTITRVFDAPIHLVYEAWTRAEHAERWMKCDPEATMKLEGWEPRVGARFRYHMVMQGKFDVTTTGRILEADSPRRFSYETDPAPELGAPRLTIRVELESVEDGTKLTLTHSGLPSRDFCGIVEGGWSVSLRLLGDLVTSPGRQGGAS